MDTTTKSARRVALEQLRNDLKNQIKWAAFHMDKSWRGAMPEKIIRERIIRLREKVTSCTGHISEVCVQQGGNQDKLSYYVAWIRKYTDVTELTPEILYEFIDKIVVHHREQLFGETVQKVEIYYKMIGFVELPSMSKSEKENYINCFSRKKKDRIA